MASAEKILTKNLDRGERIRKILLIILIVVVVLLLLIFGVLMGVGNYLVDFAVKRDDDFSVNLDPSNDDDTLSEDDEIISDNTELFQEYSDSWLEEVTSEEVSVTSDDDLTLRGTIYYAEETSHDWMILLHGYRSTSASMINYAAVYNSELGLNCLLPDMRACGESDGDYIGMGYLDSYDVLKWIDLVISIDPEADIVIAGNSMGGATTMMVSGLEEELPDNVRCFIEDCGYTSVWDIFAHELDYLFGLPTFPILNFASTICSWKVGYSFEEASSLDRLTSSTLPMLFIHGEEDAFVPYYMFDTIVDAKTEGVKESLSIPGAGHCESYLRDPETYFQSTFSFLETYLHTDTR